ncbi:hypothetical protein NDU88_007440 [Pleurodeles waltl]|uniref:Basic proline-rich protein-like n=1 Tax=Pleurodeles waltl TaxID=8319 RepID=A0AAV7VSW2_PLEWA|nr:hypothetical protein NDU88_007440 [Pleurodeles waltl]
MSASGAVPPSPSRHPALSAPGLFQECGRIAPRSRPASGAGPSQRCQGLCRFRDSQHSFRAVATASARLLRLTVTSRAAPPPPGLLSDLQARPGAWTTWPGRAPPRLRPPPPRRRSSPWGPTARPPQRQEGRPFPPPLSPSSRPRARPQPGPKAERGQGPRPRLESDRLRALAPASRVKTCMSANIFRALSRPRSGPRLLRCPSSGAPSHPGTQRTRPGQVPQHPRPLLSQRRSNPRGPLTGQGRPLLLRVSRPLPEEANGVDRPLLLSPLPGGRPRASLLFGPKRNPGGSALFSAIHLSHQVVVIMAHRTAGNAAQRHHLDYGGEYFRRPSRFTASHPQARGLSRGARGPVRCFGWAPLGRTALAYSGG